MLTDKQERFCNEYMVDQCLETAISLSEIPRFLKYEKLFYVYFLIDPRNNCIFYVGKGKNKRAEMHLKENKSGNLSNHKKHNVINEITSQGFIPDVFIFANNLTNNEALTIEHLVIKKLKKAITNCQSGGYGKHEGNIVWAKNTLKRVLPLNVWILMGNRTKKQIELYDYLINELKLIASGEKKLFDTIEIKSKNGFNCIDVY